MYGSALTNSEFKKTLMQLSGERMFFGMESLDYSLVETAVLQCEEETNGDCKGKG